MVELSIGPGEDGNNYEDDSDNGEADADRGYGGAGELEMDFNGASGFLRTGTRSRNSLVVVALIVGNSITNRKPNRNNEQQNCRTATRQMQLIAGGLNLMMMMMMPIALEHTSLHIAVNGEFGNLVEPTTEECVSKSVDNQNPKAFPMISSLKSSRQQKSRG